MEEESIDVNVDTCVSVKDTVDVCRVSQVTYGISAGDAFIMPIGSNKKQLARSKMDQKEV